MSTVRGPGEADGTTIAVGSGVDALEAPMLQETFSPPRWLRDLGRASWYLAGVAWFVCATYTIVGSPGA